MHIFLAKKDNALISHCRCEDSLINMPMQLDCPWCGCGWLSICSKCRKAFTFAKGIETEESWESLARRELVMRTKNQPSSEDIERCAESMQVMMRGVEVGKTYVYLDGYYIATDTKQLRFNGWHSKHELALLPHIVALTDPSVLDRTIGSESYWKATRIA